MAINENSSYPSGSLHKSNSVGASDGLLEGICVDGAGVVGEFVGLTVGVVVGLIVGYTVGLIVGLTVGKVAKSRIEGRFAGVRVGRLVSGDRRFGVGSTEVKPSLVSVYSPEVSISSRQPTLLLLLLLLLLLPTVVAASLKNKSFNPELLVTFSFIELLVTAAVIS